MGGLLSTGPTPSSFLTFNTYKRDNDVERGGWPAIELQKVPIFNMAG